MNKNPNPGSKEAIDQGCTCPIMDNHYGKGRSVKDGKATFIFSSDCPIHGRGVK